MTKVLIVSFLMFQALNSYADSSELLQCKEKTLVVCDGQKAIVIKKKKAIHKAVVVKEIVIVEKCATKEVVVIKEVDNSKRNIISLYAQQKVTGFRSSTSTGSGTSTLKVESKSGIVPGLMYQRLFNSGLAIGGGMDTQADLMINVGIGF